jgi:hypothetical protein
LEDEQMRQLAVRLMGLGLILGLGGVVSPAIAQESGVANTAQEYNSPDAGDGLFGSNVDIWDIFHRAGSLSGSGGGIADSGFQRSQSRRISDQAASLRARQQAILEQRAAENNAAPVVETTVTGAE